MNPYHNPPVTSSRQGLRLYKHDLLISSFSRSKVNTDASGMVWIGLTKLLENTTTGYTWLSGDGTQYTNFGDSFDRSLQSQLVIEKSIE